MAIDDERTVQPLRDDSRMPLKIRFDMSGGCRLLLIKVEFALPLVRLAIKNL